MTKDLTPAPLETLAFEVALRRLEDIVQRLETGDATLEQSIQLYTEGVQLRRQCEIKLSDAEARIEQIQIGTDGTAAATTPFSAN